MDVYCLPKDKVTYNYPAFYHMPQSGAVMNFANKRI